ncbi:MAG TPA: cell division protein ZapA [Bacteroidales bacterium]|nr:cell division protein ZapA [Bacteroidales bacterium]HPT00967.1 cell division protein ZapA [Bacteroidales bacterium]
MADEIAITLTIASRPYRLFVRREEEEAIRRAAKQVEEQIGHYAENFSYNDTQDLLAMVALHFSITGQAAETEAAFTSDKLYDTLAKIDAVLTETLKD